MVGANLHQTRPSLLCKPYDRSPVPGPSYGHLDPRSGKWSCMVRLGEPTDGPSKHFGWPIALVASGKTANPCYSGLWMSCQVFGRGDDRDRAAREMFRIARDKYISSCV